MSEEAARELIRSEFENNIKIYLDSAIIFKYIQMLEQENAQLKKEYQTELDENCKLSELWKDSQVENRRLKGVLKEIREYINKMEFDEYGVLYDNGKNLFEYEPIFKDKALEIIDKGIKEDK